MRRRVYMYGAGGHAKVVMDILVACGMEVAALVDDDSVLREFNGLPVLHDAEGCSPFIISIGSNKIRKEIAERLNAGFIAAVHPTATVSPSASVGEGTVVMQGAVIQADAKIGRHCIINTASTVDHECVIGDYAHISPNVSLCGNVHVGEGTQIGVGAVVVPGVRIGKWSLVCAGSVVTKDIPDYCVAAGNRCNVIK